MGGTLYWLAVGVVAAFTIVVMVLVWLESPTAAERARQDRAHAAAEDSVPSTLDRLDGRGRR